MSCNYADGLSPYHDKGQLGLEERFDSKSVVSAKVSLLTKWINEAKHVVVHTGAGISTSAGIPDFRGPRGVWTLQAKGEKPDLSKDFNEAIPTVTHMAITKLVERGKVKHVVSQNIDGLHLRSNLQRKFLSELHGNMFTEQCSSCNRQFVRSIPVPTVGQKSLNKPCPTLKANGRPCRGRLHDTILDWEHNLPENDLGMADYHSCLSDISICLGTTMQIVPSGNLPLYTKKHGGKLVIVNLQPTKHDRKADLIIHSYVDEVMSILMKNLSLKIPKYTPKNDPTRTLSMSSEKYFEWTISDYALKKMKKIYEEKCGTKEAKKRLEMIDDDIPLSTTKNMKRKGKDDEDSDLEVLDVIVKPKRNRESKKMKKNSSSPMYNTTITIKKVTPTPKKGAKFETEKITIKKNVTPTKTKYEIVTKPKKAPKCEIVYSTDSDLCNDLDMICESDDDEMTNNFTYNFKRYLQDDIKKESVQITGFTKTAEENAEVKPEVKNEISLDEDKMRKEAEGVKEETKDPEVKVENSEKAKATEGNGCGANEHVDKQTDESLHDQEKRDNDEKGEENPVECVKNLLENSSENSSGLSDKPNGEGTPQENKSTEENGKSKKQKKEESKTCESNEESSALEKNILDRESESMDVDSENNKNNEENSTDEKNQSEVVETSEEQKHTIEGSDPSLSEEKQDKNENTYNNIESSLESQIDQMVKQAECSDFEAPLTSIPHCNITNSVSENYEFYSNDYSSSNNPSDLDYYNNF